MTAPATVPPAGLAGLEPGWSRLVTTPDLDGADRTWHVLDTAVDDPTTTLLCVHGNPSWSYLWRDLLARAPADVRVVAVDQLDMGFSERTGTVRGLQQRVDDLCALTEALDLRGPVVTVAHDWGGPISLGWAARHVDRLDGIVLLNTAVHQPEGSPAPTLIRMARLPGVLRTVCVATPTFIEVALGLSRPRIPAAVRAGFLAPYGSAARRVAVGGFVRDIPLDPSHPSADALERIVAGIDSLEKVPTLLLWGPSDPVFSDIYLRDLEARFPHADVHRFVGASHFVSEDADVAGAVLDWLAARREDVPAPTPASPRAPAWDGLDARADDLDVAMVEMTADGPGRSATFAELGRDVHAVAAGLAARGVGPGDRVALLVPPGVDLTVCAYACWRIGAVVVLVDAGLGPRGISRALTSAAPAYLVGIPRALVAARALRWPGTRIAVDTPSPARARALRIDTSLDALRAAGRDLPLPAPPADDDLAAVVFTSGATGPAKGVRYRHAELQAQRDLLVRTYGIRPTDAFVAAFAPFSLYGPAMGVPSVVPDMDVTAPATLRAGALADAAAAIGATLVFASPAALTNVVATAGDLTAGQRDALGAVRMVLSAGAPVPTALLHRVATLMPHAEPHVTYGMTEALPVADITLAGIDAAGAGDGVCVGRPVDGVEVAVGPLGPDGRAAEGLTDAPGVTGEVVVRGEHLRAGYDKLWLTERSSSRPAHWHRSGDVGHLDAEGRLWIEGRMQHVIAGPDGPVTPVGIEQAVETLPGVAQAAAVGVGPRGTSQVVVVVVPAEGVRRPQLAPPGLAAAVREVAGVEIAAVLVVARLPVDKRHNSKIDRTRVGAWAASVLAGGRRRGP